MLDHRKIFQLMFALAAFAMLGCSGENTSEFDAGVEQESQQDAEETAYKVEKIQEIFYTIPSPIEMASLLKEAGTAYNKTILNDIQNVDQYTSILSKGMNLGIYAADLHYTSIFDQTQESMFYISCAKKLADELGVTSAFSNETIERIESNLENRDSLLPIISETFWALDGYLKDNDRDNVSALVIAGGWIEGLYIATQISTTATPPDALVERIADQKHPLNDMIGLIETYGKDEILSDVLQDLRGLKKVYDEIDVEDQPSTVDTSGGTIVLGGGPKVLITQDQLDKVRNKVAEIRNKYIQ